MSAGGTYMPPSLPIHRTATRQPPPDNKVRESAPFSEHAARSAQVIEAARMLANVPVTVRYVRTAPMRVTGEATGRRYEFSGAWPVQTVDPRDLSSLLSTGYFSRA
jgi:hypothetical protein